MVQFMDTKHVRVFGENSLYSQAINQLGLSNAWTEKTNSWGFSMVGIDKLAGIKAQIVIVDPLPHGGEQQLAQDQFSAQEAMFWTTPGSPSFQSISSGCREIGRSEI